MKQQCLQLGEEGTWSQVGLRAVPGRQAVPVGRIGCEVNEIGDEVFSPVPGAEQAFFKVSIFLTF